MNAAANPALAPLVIKYFSSIFVFFKVWLKPCPIAAPSCTDGPSLPSERPAAIQSIPPKNLARATLNQFILSLPKRIPFICGIPLPEAMGAILIIKPTAHPPNTKNISQTGISHGFSS